MKRFCLKTAAYVLLFALLPALLSAWIDPFNVFHPLQIRDNGVEVNKNYVKMYYVLHNPDRFDALLFGSSRVGDLHVEKIPDVHCYNMTYPNGLPAEHLQNLQTLFAEGVALRRVYLGVDVLSYTNDPQSHLSSGLHAPYELSQEKPLTFWPMYLDPAVTWKAVVTTMKSHQKKPGYPDYFYAYGWNHDYGTPAGEHVLNRGTEALVSSVRRMPQTLDEIAQIVKLCRENRVEAVETADYLTFLTRLAAITPYYNFSGHNPVSDNFRSYYDPSHPSAETGDLVLACLGGDRIDDLYEKGFGWLVNPENVAGLIRLLKEES